MLGLFSILLLSSLSFHFIHRRIVDVVVENPHILFYYWYHLWSFTYRELPALMKQKNMWANNVQTNKCGIYAVMIIILFRVELWKYRGEIYGIAMDICCVVLIIWYGAYCECLRSLFSLISIDINIWLITTCVR